MSQSIDNRTLVTPEYMRGFHINDKQSKKYYPDGGGEPSMDNIPDRVTRLEATQEHILSDLSEIKSDIREIRQDVSNLKYWIIGSVITMLAVVIAFAQYQASWLQRSQDKYEAYTKERIAENEKWARQMLEKMDKRIEQLEQGAGYY